MVGPELPSAIVAGLAFVGRGGGAVKALDGFRKQHHTVPDAANAVTNAFLSKICADELAAEAEQLFQSARAAFDYRRKDLTLAVASPLATLTTKHFTVEIAYALEEADPARYAITTTLRDLKSAELAHTPELAAVFAGKFTELSFALKKGARVEAVVDAIEGLDGEGGLAVSYPSDCRECDLTVAGVDARVRCTGATLDMIFPRPGGPAELLDSFLAVREAFAISKALGGLIG
jgi:hypothetical protein